MDQITIISYYDDYSGDRLVNKTLQELCSTATKDDLRYCLNYDNNYIIFYDVLYTNDNNNFVYKSETYTLIFEYKNAYLFIKNTLLPSSYSYYDNTIKLTKLNIISQNNYQRVQQFTYGIDPDNKCSYFNPDNTFMKYINARYYDTKTITDKLFTDPILALFQLAIILKRDYESTIGTVNYNKFDIVKNGNNYDLICTFNVGGNHGLDRGFIKILQGDNHGPLHGFFSSNYPPDSKYWLDTVLSQFKDFITSEKTGTACFNLHSIQVISTGNIKPNLKFEFDGSETDTIYLDPPEKYCSGNGGIIETNGRKCSRWSNVSYTPPTYSPVNTCRPSGNIYYITENQQINFNGKTFKCINDDGQLTLQSLDKCPANKVSVEWPVTDANTTVTLPCPLSQYGNYTRTCNADAKWENENNNCYFVTCPTDTYTFTNSNDTSIGLSSGTFISTFTGNNSYVDCPTGFVGNVQRTCNLVNSNTKSAVWSEPVNKCVPDSNYMHCQEEISNGMIWPSSTYSITPVYVNCPHGYTGTAKRRCGLNGWEEEIVSTACHIISDEKPIPNTTVTPESDVYCSADGDWSRVVAGSSATTRCPNGYTGMMSRKCSTSGWEAVNSTACQLVCPSSTINNISIPETVAGSSIKVLCDENSSSYATIKCGEDGKWGEMDKSECESSNIVAIIILVVVVIAVVIVIFIFVGKSKSSQSQGNGNNN